MLHVEAKECIKTHKQWKSTLHSIQEIDPQKSVKMKGSRREKQTTTQTIAKSISSKKEMKPQSNNTGEQVQMSKGERKVVFKDCKRMFNESLKSWSDSSSSPSTEEDDALSIPSNFKRYTIEDRKIKLQIPQKAKPLEMGESYDCSEDAKRVDLANLGEEPRPVYIATNMLPEEEEQLQPLSNIETSSHGVIKTLRG